MHNGNERGHLEEERPDSVLRMRERWIEIQGLRIHYLVREADGPEIIVLPGGVLDTPRLTWKKILEGLPEGYRVLALDFPGYGGSDQPERAPTTPWYADVVQTFMQRLDISSPVMLASSRSGAIALELARRAAGETTSLKAMVLVGPHGLQERVPLHEAAYLLSRANLAGLVRPLIRRPEILRHALRVAIRDPKRIDRELVEDALHEARRPRALDTFFGWLREELLPHSIRSNYRPDVSRIDLPVLILQGRYDWIVPVEAVREAAASFPNAELRILETGHMAPRERPDEAIAAVNQFLATHAPL